MLHPAPCSLHLAACTLFGVTIDSPLIQMFGMMSANPEMLE